MRIGLFAFFAALLGLLLLERGALFLPTRVMAPAFLFMPLRPKSPCTWPGCRALTDSGRCEQHRSETRRELDARRGSAHARGYGAKWQKASKAFLRAHPLCQCPECKEGQLQTTLATVVDHVTPHRGDMGLFWDSNNWQSMSKTCHDRKTAREDGGFGRGVGVGRISGG